MDTTASSATKSASAASKGLTSNPTIARLIEHARTPLFRNGYALVFSSASTSALGVLYWVLAARSYSTTTVGLNSAAISTMVFLANLAQLGLGNALIRFIPSAGRSTKHLILSAYGISLLGGLFTSLVFLLGIQLFSPELSGLFANPAQGTWFIISTMGWCVFVLQDSALTGLRQATWVPVENIAYALIKMLLLVVMAVLLPTYGLFVSWTLPVLMLMVPVNWLIFRRLIPRHVQQTQAQAAPVSVKGMVHYVAGDYFSSLIWTATASLLPLLVVERLGAEANAYFYLPWTIAYSLYLVSRNMGMSFIAEAAHDESKLNLYAQRTFNQSLRIVGLIVLGVVITAPLILAMFGREYAVEGVLTMQLLVLSALPYVVVSQFISLARVKRNIRALVYVQAALGIIVIVLSVVLMAPMGITGVGVAWLVGQGAVAIVLLLTSMRSIWLTQVNTRPIVALLSGPRRLLTRLARNDHRDEVNAMLPAVLSTVRPLPGMPAPATWHIDHMVRTLNDVRVAMLGPAGGEPVALMKVAISDSGDESLNYRVDLGEKMWNDPHLVDWRGVLPKTLATGHAGGHAYLVEPKIAGVDLSKLAKNQAAFEAGQTAAVAKLTEMHRLTGRLHRIDDATLAHWVHEPAAVLRDFSWKHLHGGSYYRSIERLTQSLEGALAGREMWVSRIHGDFAPGNILVSKDGATVTGLVDWEMSTVDDLSQLDVMQLVISSRTLVRRREMGDIVLKLMSKENWTAHEQSLMDCNNLALNNEEMSTRELVLLCWLRQVADTLQKSDRYTTSWIWSIKNIEQVLLKL